MRVFVTGATGFVGQAVVDELLNAGHSVLGLARSESSAAALKAKGVDVLHGTIEDTDCLKRGASESDGVIYLAFGDFTKFKESSEVEGLAIAALSNVLLGTDRPLIIAGGTLSYPKKIISTEDTAPDLEGPLSIRSRVWDDALKLASQGLRISLVRLSPTTHDDGDRGFISIISQFARAKGESIYTDDGSNRWPAVHRRDAARLYLLALEKGVAGATYHAVGEEGVSMKEIAEAIGQVSGIPTVSKTMEQTLAHFDHGFAAYPFTMDNPTSSKKTQEQLGWKPSGPGLLDDIRKGVYNSVE
ncbi:hypothetical protein N7492_006940 [Penicillium capsulatum]|uniref:NAD-dependent epimerase/dehydratase domain-containing protein n=1 Tax=Penicillium capsulatum TaxID=69766 RepID=A0A9W9I152_9EURO|nr:hypothetical protein N7492_006940 [Penicillium capsulatum]KAJ6116773.1 hypothetical protein N7512_006498 [Penicillium capsulatum]